MKRYESVTFHERLPGCLHLDWAGTYTTSLGKKRRLYLCNVCGGTFSKTAMTPLHHLKTSQENVIRTLNELGEGNGAAARFLSDLRDGLEAPMLLLW